MFSSRVLLRQLIYIASLLAVLASKSLASKLEHTGVPSSHRLSDVGVMPFLLQLRNENATFICAASLIAPQYAITGAECFKEIDFTKVTVVAGATTLWDAGEQRQISKISKYPKKHVNLAVLKLNAPLPLRYKPIPLTDKPVEECDREGLFRLVGWRHLARPRSTAKDLHTNELRIATHNTCEMSFFMAETKKLFCLLGNRHEDQVCTADAGGPALCDGKLYGVVSKGHQCGYADHVVSVTNVFDVLSFIEDEMI